MPQPYSRIFGLDFTSAPSRRKPIVCAEALRTDDQLIVQRFLPLTSWAAFELWLGTPGEWLAGVDFPLSQPRRWLEAMGWGETWPEMIATVAGVTKAEFIACVDAYRAQQPVGAKEHRRATDVRVKAISPMKVYGVPVGRMFFEGAPRLAQTSLSIWPCRPTTDPRTVIEIYPALVARAALNQPYKRAGDDTERGRRQMILDWLGSAACRDRYGHRVIIPPAMQDRALDDAQGDYLDALLAALQTAWASTQPRLGVPTECDALEGWIVDPSAE